MSVPKDAKNSLKASIDPPTQTSPTNGVNGDQKWAPSAKPAQKVDAHLGEFRLVNGKLVKDSGLNWVVAALFIVADMAGAGIVALPKTVIECGFYPGILLIFLMGMVGTSSAIVLGKAWVILLRLFPEYRTHCRQPYSEIGYRACGQRMRSIVALVLNVTQFGIGTSFLLLISRSGSEILETYDIAHLHFCVVILIAAAVILPVLLLKSPNDFWPVVVAGMGSTVIAVILIAIGSSIDFEHCRLDEMPPIRPSAILFSLGIVLFTFGGHSALPTVQHDMRVPSDFTKSSFLAFSIIALMNLIVVGLAGVVYGNTVKDTVISSIRTDWLKTLVNLMIVTHCLLTFPLMVNPLNQQVEEMFGITQGFGIKRILIRICLLVLITFTSLSIPSFDDVMALLGASTLTIMSLVFPPIFYLFLAAAERKNTASISHMIANEKSKRQLTDLDKMTKKIGNNNALTKNRNSVIVDGTNLVCCELEPIGFKEMIQRTDTRILIFCFAICFVGVVGGTVATVQSIRNIVSIQDLKPCYLHLFD